MSTPEWLVAALGFVGLPRLLRAMRGTASWLKPVGLARGKALSFMIGETAYISSHPYIADREVKDIIVEVILGNPNPVVDKTTMTFRLSRIHRRTPMDGVRAAEGGG